MELDERLRQLTGLVPPPPPGDAPTVYRRGTRRRRWHQAGRAATVLVIVGVLGLGVASLVDRPARLDIADQPSAPGSTAPAGDNGTTASTDGPLVASRPPLILSSMGPFAWAVGVSPTDDGRWCATAARGTIHIADKTGQPCDQPLAPPQAGDVTWYGSRPDRGPGAPAQGLSWGLAPTDAHKVLVEFTDGTRREAPIATVEGTDVTLWAIAYENVDIKTIEAVTDHGTTGTAVLDGFDVLDLLQLLGWLVGVVAVIGAATWLRRRHL